VIGGLLVLGLLATIWPWATRIHASNDPTDATTFRAWRVNFMHGTFADLIGLFATGYYLTVFVYGLIFLRNFSFTA